MNNVNELALGVIEYPFPENLSNKINKKIEESGKFDWVNSGISSGNINTKVRSSKDMVLDHSDILVNKIKEYIYKCAAHYCQRYSASVSFDIDMGILKYEKGGEYKYHSDSCYSNYRVLSCLVYLNPEQYEGGETDFKFINLKIKPDSPKLIFFPSNYIYTHASLPVTNGIKYVIVGWMNDVPKEV